MLKLAVILAAASALAKDEPMPLLWQERVQWDGLHQARQRAARASADGAVLGVVRKITDQINRQSENASRLRSLTAEQLESLEFVFSQKNPEAGLKIIQGNLLVLSAGTERLRNNLFFLTARLRFASSQALPDPALNASAKEALASAQQTQAALRELHSSAAGIDTRAHPGDDFFRFTCSRLLKTAREAHESVFSVFNAAQELAVFSKPA